MCNAPFRGAYATTKASQTQSSNGVPLRIAFRQTFGQGFYLRHPSSSVTDLPVVEVVFVSQPLPEQYEPCIADQQVKSAEKILQELLVQAFELFGCKCLATHAFKRAAGMWVAASSDLLQLTWRLCLNVV